MSQANLNQELSSLEELLEEMKEFGKILPDERKQEFYQHMHNFFSNCHSIIKKYDEVPSTDKKALQLSLLFAQTYFKSKLQT